MQASIGFLGAGNMGSAIIRGLADRKDLNILAFDPMPEKLDELKRECGAIPKESEREVAAEADYLVLAVKPQQMAPVLESVLPDLKKDVCLISIAAGIPSKSIREMSKKRCPVVRVMPNTPALVRAGVFAVCLEDEKLSMEQKEFVQAVFEPLGQVHVLPEKDFDAFTAVIGSGPAYVCYFMEALIESAVYLGLPRPKATQMVEGLFSGTSKLVEESDFHVSVLREMVTSPGGTTIRALQHMDRQAVRAAIVEAVEESYLRSIELGK